jgi:L-ascorbate metabolism protein UlaG (beta-lactamase superfamily)
MRITKREHACLVLEQEKATLVIDPGHFTAPFRVPGLVAIVVTHEHGDHVTRENLDRLLTDAQGPVELFAPAGVAAAHPDYHWQIVDGGDVRAAGPFSLAFSGSRHAMIHRSIAIVDNVGVFVNETVYYPGDSFTVPTREVPVLAVPSSAPWLKIGEVMDYLEAVKPRLAFPTHEKVNSDTGNAMANARITSVVEGHGGRVIVLQPGESLDVD